MNFKESKIFKRDFLLACMGGEGFYNLIAAFVVIIFIVGALGYYLGSVGVESNGDEGGIAVNKNTEIVEEKSNAIQPPTVENTTSNIREWVVEIKNMGFVPSNLTINKSDRVTWINRDWLSHKIEADGVQFISRPLETNDIYSVILGQAGVYKYHCKIHPGEAGVLIVK